MPVSRNPHEHEPATSIRPTEVDLRAIPDDLVEPEPTRHASSLWIVLALVLAVLIVSGATLVRLTRTTVRATHIAP